MWISNGTGSGLTQVHAWQLFLFSMQGGKGELSEMKSLRYKTIRQALAGSRSGSKIINFLKSSTDKITWRITDGRGLEGQKLSGTSLSKNQNIRLLLASANRLFTLWRVKCSSALCKVDEQLLRSWMEQWWKTWFWEKCQRWIVEHSSVSRNRMHNQTTRRIPVCRVGKCVDSCLGKQCR